MSDSIAADASTAASLPPSIAAGAEAVGCLIALLVAAGLFKSFTVSSVRAVGSTDAALLDLFGGAAQVAGIFAAFIILYARRLRPAAHTWLHASWQVMRSFVHASLPVVPSMGATTLMIYNAVFVALAYWRGGSSFHERLLACSSQGPLLWSPLIEEILFRGAIFWVALHRARGDAKIAMLVSTCAFAAIHIPLVLSARVHMGYVALQVIAAASLGGVWSSILAANGKLFEVFLLHIANNIAGTAWIALVGAEEGAVGAAACDHTIPAEQWLRSVGAASLILQIALASSITASSWLQISNGGTKKLINTHPMVFFGDEDKGA
jgi:hypothetical protein